MNLSTYPSYKDSRVEWLGKIPSDWNLIRLKYLCKIQTGSKDTVNAIDDGQYPFFVRSQTVERINSYSADCEAVLTAGDGVGVGKVFHYYEGKFDYHQRVYMFNMFKNCLGKFLFYYLKSNFFKVALEGSAKSTVDSLRLPLIQNFEFCTPSINEQKTILHFLDRETAKIDLLIDKQQQLIKLLEEKRQAVISHAVTKGLNPDAPMKDSGVEWLSQLPEHWTSTRIKFTAQTNPSKSKVRTLDNETLVSFIPMESIGENGELNLSQTKKISEVINGYTFVGEDDVIIAKITPCFENGKGSIARGLTNNIAFATTEVVPLRPNDLISSDFLYHLLSANPFRKIAEGSMYGAGGQKRVSDTFVSNYTFALPPQAEQSAIVSFIKITIDKLDLLKYKATQAIELMKERRTSLISAAVTGKIDVRNTI